MQAGQKAQATLVFQAPVLYIAVFYLVLLAWTIGTVPVIYQQFHRGIFGGDWLYGVMIAFFYLYTWYWVLGLCYSVSLDPEGRVVLRSMRRRLEVSAKQVSAIEGSRFPGGFGFVRFKLSRESGYVFCHGRNQTLDEILAGIKKINPLLRTVRI